MKISDNGDVDVISSTFGGKCASVMPALVVVIGQMFCPSFDIHDSGNPIGPLMKGVLLNLPENLNRREQSCYNDLISFWLFFESSALTSWLPRIAAFDGFYFL